MIRPAFSIFVAFLVWFVVATVCNFGLRVFVPDYAAAEKTMAFSGAMLFGRLVVGAVASLAAGWACSRVGGQRTAAVTLFALLLTIFFVPVHYGLWDRFPFWYHAAFLASLAPFASLGALRKT
jgi:hypothetical protein